MALSGAAWSRLKPLLEQALELQGAERQRFVDAIGERDPELQADLCRMLADAETTEDALGDLSRQMFVSAAEQLQLDDPDHARLGSVVGAFQLETLLGSGGMGAVYLGRRVDGQFQQRLAVKLMHEAGLSALSRERFARERDILAQLVHPNIAQLFDGGVTADGAPYFTMEYVEGEAITEYCLDHVDSVAGRVRLLIQVAQGLSFAHRNLVIHRDIKPSNILVRADGQVKLVDFGIAKLLAGTSSETLTQGAVGPMTPQYAAPEQFQGTAVTVATDIYQFGALAYRLLAGQLPYGADPDDRVQWAVAVTQHQVRSLRNGFHSESTRDGHTPSPVWSQHIDRRRVGRELSRDLDAILQRAMAKAPEDRYGSMDALIADLRAFLDGRPVSARAVSVWYEAGRFVARNRLLVGLSLLALIAICTASLIAMRQAVAARAAAGRAQVEAQNAQQIADFMTKLFEVSDPGENRGRTLNANDILAQGRIRVDQELADNPLLRGRMEWVIGNVYSKMGEFKRAAEVMDSAIAAFDSAAADPIELSKGLRGRAFVGTRLGDHRGALTLLDRAQALLTNANASKAQSELGEVLGVRAMALKELQRYPESTAAFRQSIAIVERESGALASGSIHNNLGLLLLRVGDRLGAADEFARALEIHRKVHGSEHPRSIGTMSNLAMVLTDLGKEKEAITLAREVVAIDERVLGRSNGAAFANDLGVLAVALYADRQLDEALAISARALDVLQAAGAEHSPNYAFVLAVAANCELRKGAAAPALQRALAAWSLMQELAGPDAEDTLTLRVLVAKSLLAVNRIDEALAHLRAVIKQNGASSPYARADALRVLAKALITAAQPVESAQQAMLGLQLTSAQPARSADEIEMRDELQALAAGP